MKINPKLLSFVAGALALPAIALAAGNWETLPIVGGASSSGGLVSGYTGTGSQTGTGPGLGNVINSTTVTAGPPALTGYELIPADTGVINGPQQTVTIPSALFQFATNRIIGGEFDTNPAQRLSTTKGIASLASLSPTAAVISADRWWVIAPAAGVTVTMDSTAATATVPALQNKNALRVARTSSGAAGVTCIGQTLDKQASAPLLGNNAVLSFWEENGTTQSATNGNITVNIDYTSQADAVATQATLGFAGANGSIFALGDTGGSTAGLANYTHAIAGTSVGTIGSVAAGIATIPASTTWTRYAVYAPIPLLVPGTTTPVTEVSVSICWMPIATTAVATDYIEIEGVQLEAKPSTVTNNFVAGVTSPSTFERRPAEVEAMLAYYYWYYNFENQTTITPVASCMAASVTQANCLLNFPIPMRLAPAMKFTAGFQIGTTTGYTAINACSALGLSTTYATVASNQSVLMNCTAATIPAAGSADMLTALGTASATGIIVASAEP